MPVTQWHAEWAWLGTEDAVESDVLIGVEGDTELLEESNDFGISISNWRALHPHANLGRITDLALAKEHLALSERPVEDRCLELASVHSPSESLPFQDAHIRLDPHAAQPRLDVNRSFVLSLERCGKYRELKWSPISLAQPVSLLLTPARLVEQTFGKLRVVG